MNRKEKIISKHNQQHMWKTVTGANICITGYQKEKNERMDKEIFRK